MALSSRTSAASKPSINPQATAAQPAHSVTLPLLFIVSGLLALFGSAVWLVLRPDLLATYHYNQTVVAATHLFVLGFIGSVVMGAVYQLIPVALETQLHSRRLAQGHFAMHIIGVPGMVWMLAVWDMKQVVHFGSIFAVGVFLFVLNIALTLRRIPRWNVISAAIVSSMFWLACGVLAGLFAAASKLWAISPFSGIAQMHAHAHFGGLGCFIMLIVGVSYKLVPMFALTEIQSARRAWISIGLLNLSIAGLAVTIAVESRWKLLFALSASAGLLVYGFEMRSILQARRRRNLDWGLRHFVTAISLLAPLSLIALVLCWPGLTLTPFTGQLENAYGFLALAGVVGGAILGMLYKIIPFLVWLSSYSTKVGRHKVPALSELFSPRVQQAGYFTFFGGIAAVTTAIVCASPVAVRWSCVVLLLSIGLFLLNALRMFRHLVWPRIEPLHVPVIPTPAYERTQA